MSLLPAILLSLLMVYAAACGLLGVESGAPLWLRWPLSVWNWIAHGWRRTPELPRRPDHAKIAQLERELGIGEVEPERPMRLVSKVCLTKDCGGDTEELRTWSGVLIARVHRCG